MRGKWVKRDGVKGVGTTSLIDYLFLLARTWQDERTAGTGARLHEWRMLIEEFVPPFKAKARGRGKA